MTIRRQLVLWFLVHESNWLSASSSSSCTRCSHDGATIVGEARWAGLYVVIRGAHQPRYREATCQYFGQLLHQSEGHDAERENRLAYTEGLCDVNSALDLLARPHCRSAGLESFIRRPATSSGGSSCRRRESRRAETFSEDARLPKWRTSARTISFPSLRSVKKSSRLAKAFGVARSPRRPFPRFEFVVVRGDSWLGWHSIFNHI
jgi:hypothetical protein